MKNLLTAIRRAWLYFQIRATEDALHSVNRALDDTEGEYDALLHHREEVQKELAHYRAEYLAMLKPGDRATWGMA